MRFALVGDNPAMLPLVQAIAESQDHELTHAALVGDMTGDLLKLAPRIKIVDDWPELLTVKKLGAVLIGGDDARVQEAARRLASEKISLVVFPCVAYGEGLAYELSLIQDERGISLWPAVPFAKNAFVSMIHHAIEEERDSLLGDDEEADDELLRVREIRMQRRLRSSKPSHILRQEFEEILLHDLVVMGEMSRTYNRVTAVLTGVTDEAISTGTITLNGNDLPDAVWTCESADEDGWTITIRYDTFEQTVKNGESLEDFRSLDNTILPPQPRSPNECLLHEIAPAIQAELTLPSGTPVRDFNWTDLVRAYEQLHAVRKSIRKGRTIELHFEDTSERSQFKSQMTAIGCGVLTLTFFGVLAYLGVAAVFDNRTGLEKRAEVRNAILYDEQFESGQSTLTETGRDQLDELIEFRSFPIVIEETGQEKLDSARKDRVIGVLEDASIENAATQTEVLPIAGPTLAMILKVTRILVFLPLFLFLICQLLLLITKPARS